MHAGSPPAAVDYHRAGICQQRSQGVQASTSICGRLPCFVASAATVGLCLVIHSHLLHGHESAISCLEPYEGISAPARSPLAPGALYDPIIAVAQKFVVNRSLAAVESQAGPTWVYMPLCDVVCIEPHCGISRLVISFSLDQSSASHDSLSYRVRRCRQVVVLICNVLHYRFRLELLGQQRCPGYTFC